MYAYMFVNLLNTTRGYHVTQVANTDNNTIKYKTIINWLINVSFMQKRVSARTNTFVLPQFFFYYFEGDAYV